MPNITSLHPKASKILDIFFTKIQGITISDFSQRQQLLKRTQQLFNNLDRLGAEKFSEIFKYNYFYSSIEEVNKKYYEALLYLVTCVIEKYSESDLLRYFLPQGLSQKENRPEYSDHTSRLGHWFQLIGYRFRQLLNKPIYTLNPENSLLTDSVKYIKASHKKSYVENSVDVDLRTHLSKVLIQFEKRLINSQAEDLAKQGIIGRERIVARKEEEVSEKEKSLANREESVINSRIIFQEERFLFSQDREEREKKNQDLEKEIKELKKTILDLKKAKRDEKAYIEHLINQDYKNQKALEELAEEMGVLPSTSQNIEATVPESLTNSFSSVIETSGQSNQDIRANIEPKLSRSQSNTASFNSALETFAQPDQSIRASVNEPKFYRNQSYASFFSEQSSTKANQLILRTTKSNAELYVNQSDAPFSSALDVFSSM